jgi:hypothetical protein
MSISGWVQASHLHYTEITSAATCYTLLRTLESKVHDVGHTQMRSNLSAYLCISSCDATWFGVFLTSKSTSEHIAKWVPRRNSEQNHWCVSTVLGDLTMPRFARNWNRETRLGFVATAVWTETIYIIEYHQLWRSLNSTQVTSDPIER